MPNASEEFMPQLTIDQFAEKYALITDEALSRRQIHLIDEISAVTFEQVKHLYDALIEQDDKAPIHFIVGSAGGDVRSMMGIMNLILISKIPCYTYLMGETCSAGAWIFLCGHKRFVSNTPFVSFMIHPVEWGKEDSLGNHASHQAYVQSLSDSLLEMTESRTLIPKRDLRKLLSTETKYFTGASDLMKNGIATDLLDTATFWYIPKGKEPKSKKDKSKKEIEFLVEQQQ
jgi:ATP-dependent protease ClpP protease subunit